MFDKFAIENTNNALKTKPNNKVMRTIRKLC